MEYKINTGPCETGIDIKKAEAHYGGKYIGDFCLKSTENTWVNEPVSIFYQPNPNITLGHSHYFGLFIRNGIRYITKGDNAFSEPIVGIVGKDGEVVYSRYRWDFRALSDKSGCIDGGRDYLKIIGGEGCFPERVHIVIDGPNLVVKEIQLEDKDLV